MPVDGRKEKRRKALGQDMGCLLERRTRKEKEKLRNTETDGNLVCVGIGPDTNHQWDRGKRFSFVPLSWLPAAAGIASQSLSEKNTPITIPNFNTAVVAKNMIGLIPMTTPLQAHRDGVTYRDWVEGLAHASNAGGRVECVQNFNSRGCCLARVPFVVGLGFHLNGMSVSYFMAMIFDFLFINWFWSN